MSYYQSRTLRTKPINKKSCIMQLLQSIYFLKVDNPIYQVSERAIGTAAQRSFI